MLYHVENINSLLPAGNFMSRYAPDGDTNMTSRYIKSFFNILTSSPLSGTRNSKILVLLPELQTITYSVVTVKF